MSLRVLLVVAVFGPALVAQTPTGTIVGTVTDPSRAAVAGAQIEFINDQTGQRRTGMTDTDGSLRVSDLPVGVYTATVVAAGCVSPRQRIESSQFLPKEKEKFT